MPIVTRSTLPGSLKTHSENSAVAVAVKLGEGVLKPQTAADQRWRGK